MTRVKAAGATNDLHLGTEHSSATPETGQATCGERHGSLPRPDDSAARLRCTCPRAPSPTKVAVSAWRDAEGRALALALLGAFTSEMLSAKQISPAVEAERQQRTERTAAERPCCDGPETGTRKASYLAAQVEQRQHGHGVPQRPHL